MLLNYCKAAVYVSLADLFVYADISVIIYALSQKRYTGYIWLAVTLTYTNT